MLEEGCTAYMRPLPGAARMYPETDVVPVTISSDWFDSLPLPELLTEKRDRFVRDLQLDPALASQLAASEQVFLFERMVAAGISPALAARTLLSTMKELSRAGTDVRNISDQDILDILSAVEQGKAAKEAIPSILGMVSSGVPVTEALRECAPAMSREELRAIVKKIVEERSDFVIERGNGALGPLMGPVMNEVRGSVDGKLVSEVLRQEIAAHIKEKEIPPE